MFEMRRRDFFTLLAGYATAAWPFTLQAQQADHVRRIGLLTPLPESHLEAQARLKAFRQGLEKLGWKEGRDFRIEYWWTTDKDVQAAAAKLVASSPDIIVVNSTNMLSALKSATESVPIVFVQVPDPVTLGLVSSLAKPAGNITGFTNFEYTLGGKWLELLREIAPGVARVAVIQNPGDQSSSQYTHAIRAAAQSPGVPVTADDAQNEREIESTVVKLAAKPNAGLIVLPGVFSFTHRDKIVALAAQHRLPAVYPYGYFTSVGGLISYGVETTDLYRRAASYVDRILKGEKPGDLPVQAPTKFEMIINLKTAKVLGLDVPLLLQQLADEVIE
jgi:putative tryptophan/tyrosine transport system substrate-binding protein